MTRDRTAPHSQTVLRPELDELRRSLAGDETMQRIFSLIPWQRPSSPSPTVPTPTVTKKPKTEPSARPQRERVYEWFSGNSGLEFGPKELSEETDVPLASTYSWLTKFKGDRVTKLGDGRWCVGVDASNEEAA